MLLLDVSEQCGIAEIALTTWTDVVSVIEIVACFAFALLRVLTRHVRRKHCGQQKC